MGLPDLNVPWLKAKIDTGAQTSALHASDVAEFRRDGADWVRFTVHPWQHNDLNPRTIELPVHDRRAVRSSSGHSQDRLVVLMTIEIAGRSISAEVTLTSRHAMVFRMLVGRQALAQGFLVDPGASFLGGRPDRAVRRRNLRQL